MVGLAQHQECRHGYSVLPLCIQLVYWNSVLFLFRCDQLRRLDGRDFRTVSALVVAGFSRGRRSCYLLRRCPRRCNRARAYVGVPRDQQTRLRKLTIVPYVSAILLSSVAGLLNPLGTQLLWQSALPATAGGQSGLLWLQYHIPRETATERTPDQLGREIRVDCHGGDSGIRLMLSCWGVESRCATKLRTKSANDPPSST